MAGIGLGRLLGGEHASTPQSGVEAPRLLKRSLPRLYCCCCCCCCVVVVVVVVEWLYYSKRIIIVRWADLSDFFFVHFRR